MENLQLRRLRKLAARKLRRRQSLLKRSGFLMFEACHEVEQFDPGECLDLLNSHLTRVKRILRRLELRASISPNSPGAQDAILKPPPIPRRVLLPSRRSWVQPQLFIPSDVEWSDPISGPVDGENQRGALICRVASLVRLAGLEWRKAADSITSRLSLPPLSDSELHAANTALQFHRVYEDGRIRYAAAVREGWLPRFASGDWGVFDALELGKLLPGAVLPRTLRRDDYVSSLNSSSTPWDLYLYSIRLKPLLVHRFDRHQR
jgi:hypothetical protein